METIESIEKLKALEYFFKEAFCADSAKLIKGGNSEFNITGVIEIKTGQKLFYIALATKKSTKEKR